MADQAAIRDNEKRAGPPLSSYGRAQVERGKLLLQMHKNMRNTYHPLHNPNGIVNIVRTEHSIGYGRILYLHVLT